MSGWAGESEEEKSPATSGRTDCQDAQVPDQTPFVYTADRV